MNGNKRRKKYSENLYSQQRQQYKDRKEHYNKRRSYNKRRLIVSILIVVTALAAIILLISGCNKNTYSSKSSFGKYANKYFDDIGGSQNFGEKQESLDYGENKSIAMQFPKFSDSNENDSIYEVIRNARKTFNIEYNGRAAKGDGKFALLLGYKSEKTDKKVDNVVMFESQREERENEMTAVVENAYTFNFSQKTGINLNPVQVFEHNYRSGLSKLVNQKLKEEYGDDLKKGYENYISPDEDNFNKFIVRDDSIVFYFDGDTVLPMSEGVVSLELKNDELAGIRRNKINLRAIDPDKPMVALTFDDGPGGKPTKRILDCLKKNGVTATFFDLGENAKSKEGKKIEQHAIEIGCEMGSHSYSHPNFNICTSAQIKSEIEKTKKIIKNNTGREPTVFRPPYGNVNKQIAKLVNLPVILWSVDTLDWRSKNAGAVVSSVKNVSNLDGKVVLMHSVYDSTAEAVEELVPWLKKNGYQLVTVSEMLRYKYKEEPKNGKLYGYNYFHLSTDSK